MSDLQNLFKEPLQGTLDKNLSQQHQRTMSVETDDPISEREDHILVVELLAGQGVWDEVARDLARLPHMTEQWVHSAIKHLKIVGQSRTKIDNPAAVLRRWCENPGRIEEEPEFKLIMAKEQRKLRELERKDRYHEYVARSPVEKEKDYEEDKRVADSFRSIWLEGGMTDDERVALVRDTLHGLNNEYGPARAREFLPDFHDSYPIRYWKKLTAALACDPSDDSQPLGISLLGACARQDEKRFGRPVRDGLEEQWE